MKQYLFFHIVHEVVKMLSYCQIESAPVYSGSCGCLSVKGRVGRDGAGSPISIHNMWCLLQRNVHGWNVYMYWMRWVRFPFGNYRRILYQGCLPIPFYKANSADVCRTIRIVIGVTNPNWLREGWNLAGCLSNVYMCRLYHPYALYSRFPIGRWFLD